MASQAFATEEALATEKEEFFESRVRPLLARKCYECHRRKAEGGLRLDSLKDMLAGGTSGPAIVPGKPQQSLLWKVIAKQHSEITMPPSEPLKEGEVRVFEKWITEGAAWPKPIRLSSTGPDEYGITDEERKFWSFQPLSPAAIANATSVRNTPSSKNPMQ